MAEAINIQALYRAIWQTYEAGDQATAIEVGGASRDRLYAAVINWQLTEAYRLREPEWARKAIPGIAEMETERVIASRDRVASLGRREPFYLFSIPVQAVADDTLTIRTQSGRVVPIKFAEIAEEVGEIYSHA